MTAPARPRPRRQGGAALIVSLIFLVLLTLLGVTIASNNTLQERMAGNTRQRDLAFQQAEIGLREADTAISNAADPLRVYIDSHIAALAAGTPPPTAPDGVRLNSQNAANDAAYWQNTFDWSNANCCAAATTTGNLDRRYVVDYMGTVAVAGPPAATHYFYRVTSRGSRGDAVVVLQAMYRFE